MSRALLIVVLNIVLTVGVHAQIIDSTRIDSLKSVIDQLKNDTTKVKLLADYSFHVVFSAPEQALSFAQEGLLLAKSLDYQKGQIMCNSAAGFTMWINGDFPEAIDVFLKSFAEAESIKDTALLWRALDGLVASHRDQGNYKEAQKFARRARDLYPNNLYAKVITGSVYNAMNLPDSALYYFLPIDTSIYPAFYGYTLLEVGKAYHQKRNVSKAHLYYKTSIDVLTKSTNIKDLALAYNGLSQLFAEEDNLDSSILYANRGLEISQKLSYMQGTYGSYLLLSSAIESTNKAEALRYYKLAMEARNEIFNTMKQTQAISSRFEAQLQQIELQKDKLSSENRIRTIALASVLTISIIIMLLLYRNIRIKQKAKQKIEQAFEQLKSTQAQLIQSEKMASLGELTAGIAHEIQNPLNFVNNFSEVSNELLDEMKEELNNGDIEEAKAISADIKQNLEKINHHGQRASSIVQGMLEHSRTGDGKKEPTDINKLADEYLRLAYHGIRAKDKSFNADFKTDFDESLPTIDVVPQDIGRVLLNLINNAFYAVANHKSSAESATTSGLTASGTESYNPTVIVSTKRLNGLVQIKVKDNGSGMPDEIKEKVFQPFFTTKPTGQGTGLGLSLVYDIIKSHGGTISLQSKIGEGTEFTIQLPYVCITD